MCLKDEVINYINFLLLVTSVLGPLLYLIYFLGIKKRNKKIGFIIVALSFFLIFFFGRDIILSKLKCEEDNPIIDTKKEEPKKTKSEFFYKETSKGYAIELIDGLYYIDGILIVNKTYPLPSDYVPKDTFGSIDDKEICELCINNEAYEKWLEMKNDAKALGHTLWIQSGYRSYTYQDGLHERYVSRNGKKAAERSSARAGFSEHQSSYAFDLNTITTEFGNTPEGIWVNDNAYKYGYIIRYPKEAEDITGYIFEPWHLRYVGTKLAKELYNDGNWITIEEYFGIDSKYN